MFTVKEAAEQRPVHVALVAGQLMATIWVFGFTNLDGLPGACLAVLAGTFTAFITYSKLPGTSQDSLRLATFLAAGVSLICLVGLLLAAVN